MLSNGDRAQPAVTSVLLGATTKLHQLDDIGSVDFQLSASELADLNEATRPLAVYPNWFIENLVDPQTAEALASGVQTTRT
jgi:hypothetical protein